MVVAVTVVVTVGVGMVVAFTVVVTVAMEGRTGASQRHPLEFLGSPARCDANHTANLL